MSREPGRCHCGAPVRGGEGDYADVCTQWPICEGAEPGAVTRALHGDRAPASLVERTRERLVQGGEDPTRVEPLRMAQILRSEGQVVTDAMVLAVRDALRAPQAGSRSYTIGLPVTVLVWDDGRVTVQVDTVDASTEIQEVEESSCPAWQVLSDSAKVGEDHDRRREWEPIFEVAASRDPEQRGAVYLCRYGDGTTVEVGNADERYGDLAALIDDLRDNPPRWDE